MSFLIYVYILRKRILVLQKKILWASQGFCPMGRSYRLGSIEEIKKTTRPVALPCSNSRFLSLTIVLVSGFGFDTPAAICGDVFGDATK